MKEVKMSVLVVKEISSRIKRKIRESRPQIAAIQVTTTVIFCLSLAFLVLFLGTFINDHIRIYLASEEDYFYPYTSFPCRSLLSPPTIYVEPVLKHNEHRLHIVSPTMLWNSSSDRELMWRASMVPRIMEYPRNQTPKVAFMFMIREKMPLAPLWELFFKGHEGLFSIYIHISDNNTQEPSASSVFYKRKIPGKPVQWGKPSMINAERRLLANALLDLSNERFVLLSESCIPVFNFTLIYDYLTNSNYNFVSSFDDPSNTGRGRYSKRMLPIVPLPDWRKGSQWFEVQRKLAIEIVSDVKYYHVFRDHCYKPPCYMDEHYLATLVAKVAPDSNSNRSITWVDWSKPGPHPSTFFKKDISQNLLQRIRSDSNCSYNGVQHATCFLFARKFHPSTLDSLTRIAPKLYGVVSCWVYSIEI